MDKSVEIFTTYRAMDISVEDFTIVLCNGYVLKILLYHRATDISVEFFTILSCTGY